MSITTADTSEIREARTRLFRADLTNPAEVRDAQKVYLDLIFPNRKHKRAQLRLVMQEA